jgi:hypothetical protein
MYIANAQSNKFWASFVSAKSVEDDFLTYSHRNANASGGFYQTKIIARPAFPDTIVSNINPLSVYDATHPYIYEYTAPCSFIQEYVAQSGFYTYRYYSVYGNKILTDSIFFSIAESSTDTTITEPPIDTAVVVPPDTAIVYPPVDTTIIVPPPPTDTTIIVPPPPPTDTTAIISPADTTVLNDDKGSIREFRIVNLIVVDEYELTYLKVINLDFFTNVELRVFSSRGEQIYHTKDYHNDLNMKSFKDGTYYYFINGVDKENYRYRTKKGFVQLYHKQ